ncbi:MAG: flagellar motor switch protein FliM [Synergistales bacterium]|nr:flagellar motor switch protein FliM [Synergistales bacterium]
MVPEVLSQEEIDSLLQAVSSGSVDIDDIGTEEEEDKVKIYDFRRPDKFSKDQLRAIQMIHESFARQLTTMLSTMVRSMVSTEVVSVDQLTYDEVVRSLVHPTTIAVLEMYPLSGNAIMEVNPQLVFSILDRMLGGKGEPLRKPRELTEIEQTVTERVVMRFLELLEESWSTVVDIRFRFESMESNPFFVQICPGSDMVLLVTLKVTLGDTEGLVNLCIPHIVMEPMVDKLSSQHWFASTARKVTEDVKDRLKENVGRIRVPLSAELGSTSLALQDVLQLQVGDVVRLDAATNDQVCVRVGAEVKFVGTPGTRKGNNAVRVDRVLTQEECTEREEV